jgi:thiopeptide-type bacteriocin biosynthesis protein
MGCLAARSEEALARGDFRVVLDHASGPSGAHLFGRFCHADPALARQLEKHLRTEAAHHPDAIFAEIVHQPEGRIGNVVCRPVFYEYEIPYLGESGVPPERQIPITDLRVSVAGAQVVLRSARLGRRVIPRLSNAHNFLNSQGIYRFLGLLQGQGVAAGTFWDWGPLRDAPFLPRVVHGRLVLSRARWRMTREELTSFGKAQGTQRWQAVQTWRGQHNLPRWVTFADGDRELPVDLDNVLSVETFVDLVRSRDEAILFELYPPPEDLVVQGPEGRFVHEFAVPFHRPVRQPVRLLPARSLCEALPGPSSALRRSFAPGSEWLYAKLYTSPGLADDVLRDVVGPVAQEVLASGAAGGWFFIRYGDPDWHLRLRFHGQPQRLRDEVWAALQQRLAPLLGDGRAWRLQLDTYEREVERYGGPEGIVLAEKLFQIDSEAVLALLAAYPEDAREEVRWRLALCGIDRLLTDLGFGLAMKSAVLKGAREDFAREFRADAALKHQLGEKYRKESRGLETLLGPGEGSDDLLAPGLAILRDRSGRWAVVMDELKQGERTGRLTAPLTSLARSCIHMHVNRLLRSAHRAQELVLYDFLSRCYESRMARACPRQCPPAPQTAAAVRIAPVAIPGG